MTAKLNAVPFRYNDCCVELVDKCQKCVAVMDYWEGK
jgi:hypothetical protein